MAKIVKTLTVSWQWSGDKYSLRGFNLAVTPAAKNPKEEVVATAFVETKEIKQTYSYKMGNVTLDKDAQYKIWVQAVYENSDSDWVATGGATVSDDGSATIITKTDREIQDVVNMASDNILTRQEKISLRREWQEIVYEFLEIESTAISQGIPSSNTAFSNFKSKGNALGTYLNGGTEWTISSNNKTSFPLWINDSNLGSNTPINGNTYRETFRVYYEAKVKILEEINKYKVNNVQVGGVNLLVGTATAKNTNVNAPTGYVTWDPYTTHNKQTLEQLGFKAGDKVTIGFDWSISKNGTNDYVYGNFRVEFRGIKSDGTDNQYLGVIKNPAGTFSSSNTKGRVEATVDLDSTTIKAHSLRFRIDNSVLNFKVSNLKMERGTKATGWSPALEEMENAYTIILTNEAQVIPTNSNRVPTSSTTYFTDIQVYKGTSQRNDYTIGTINSANGITVSKTSSRVNFAVSTDTALAADGGNFIIPITIDGKTFNKTFSWSCSKQGNTGASGVGISKITEYYAVSSSNTTEPTSWSTTVPAMTATNKYLWNYETITYSNNTTANTSKRVIGVYGDKGNTGATGATGNGISNIVNYYLATSSSSGVTTSTSGWTTSVQAVSASKKYLWNYEAITYTNGSTSTTTPCIIGAYGDTGATGPAGQDAQHVVVTGEQVFKYANNFSGEPTPATITLTATKINTTATGKWQWLNGSTWTDWTSNASTLNATTLSVSPTSGSLNTGKSIRIRYIVGSVYDEITLIKVSDGAKGENGEAGKDAYTVILTNETHTFPAQNNGNIPTALSTTTQVVAYKGASSITPTIGNLPSVSGLTLSKSGTTVTIQANTGTSLADSGSFNIPVTVDGKSFTKTFSWSKAKQGNTGATGNAGQDAITIVLSNENHTFPCESNGNIPTALSTTCVVTAYKGGTSVTPTIGAITNPTGMTITKNGATLTIQANTGTSLADSGTVNIPITVDGKTFNKTFTWSKAKKGATGATGATGAGAKTADIIASSQVFKSTDGGLTFSPTTITMTPKLQNVTYSNWQYSTNGGSNWNGFSNSISGWSVSGGVLTINKDCSLFTPAVTSVVFRLNTNDSSVYDTITIVKLYDVTEINIGGRNLYRNTKVVNRSDWGNIGNWSTSETYNGFTVFARTGAWMGLYQDIQYEVGQTYTLSAYVRGANGAKLHFYLNGSGSAISTSFSGGSTLSDSWTRVWATFKVNGSDFNKPRFENSTDGATLKIYGFKLEKGNKATDWTPAPEDVATDIDNAKNEAINSANNTLITMIADYYTKEETNSQINIAKEAINLGVSNTYETKANVETKVTSTLNSAKSYADTKKNEAINSASTDATAKANNALNNAKSYADTKKTEAINAASTDAANKVNSAKNELNTAIGKKANSIDVYTKTQVYTKDETNSQINIAKDAINLGVSQTYETKANVETKVNTTLNSAKSYADTKKNEAINSAASDATSKVNSAKNELNTKIDGIQVGGRNLIKNSNKRLNGTTPTSVQLGGVVDYQKLKGKTVTLSMDINVSGMTNVNGQYNRVGFEFSMTHTDDTTSYIGLWHNVSDGNYNGRKTKTLTIPNKDIKSLGYTGLYIQCNATSCDMGNVKLEEGNKATSWTPAPEDVNSNIDDVKNSLNSFQNTVNTSFKDGIVEQAEAKAIAQHLKTLDAEKADIDKEYSTIYSNSNLTGSAKTNLASAKTSFDSAHASLKSTINTVISDGRVSSSESASVTSTFNTYNTQLGVYKQRVQEALDAISSGKINSMQIGGTNLVLNSHFNYDRVWGKGKGVSWVQEGFDGGYCMKTVGALKETRNFGQNISINKLEKGQQYTATVWLKTQDVVRGTTNPHLYLYASYSLNGQYVTECALSKAIPNGTTAWTKYVLTFTTPTVNFDAMRVDGYGRDFTGIIWWDGIKLEKGNKASDWSPAPEDVDTNINNAKSEAINSANNTLTTTIANYYTKAQTDSQINVAKEAINLGVSSTYETKTNVETKVSSTLNSAKSYADTKKNEAISSASSDATNKANNALNNAKSYADTKKTEAINSAASDAASKVNSAKNELNTKIDNIQVGGRNLVNGTAEPFVVTHTELNKATSKSLPLSSYLQNNKNIIRNKYITFSIDVKTTNLVYGTTNPWVGFELYVGGNTPQWLGIGGKTIKAGTSDGFVRYVSTTKVNDMDITGLSLQTLARDCTGTVELVRWQIEIGSKASDWTPSPEDVNSAIDKKANSADVYTKTQVYTKEETNSQIKVAKDEINLGVSNTYETKTNVETKINAIQVGSRNWVQNSAFESNTGWVTSSGWSVNSSEKFRNNNSMYISRSGLTSDSWSELRSNKIDVKQGDKLVGSWYIKHRDCDMNSIVELWGYKADGSGRVSVANSYQIYGTNANWTRYILKGTVPANVDYVQLAISHRRNGIIYAAMPQVEYGNTATDWSPAPEDIENEITILESETKTLKESVSSLQLNSDSINASVKSLQETVTNTTNGLASDISSIQNQVNLAMTANDVKLEIQKEMAKGTNKVTTATGFTFNESGLNISKSDSEMSTRITEDGMKVYRNNDVVLTANNQGVDAKNLHATTYLIIGGNSRMESVTEDGTKRTAVFWIGS